MCTHSLWVSSVFAIRLADIVKKSNVSYLSSKSTNEIFKNFITHILATTITHYFVDKPVIFDYDQVSVR